MSSPGPSLCSLVWEEERGRCHPARASASVGIYSMASQSPNRRPMHRVSPSAGESGNDFELPDFADSSDVPDMANTVGTIVSNGGLIIRLHAAADRRWELRALERATLLPTPPSFASRRGAKGVRLPRVLAAPRCYAAGGAGHGATHGAGTSV